MNNFEKDIILSICARINREKWHKFWKVKAVTPCRVEQRVITANDIDILGQIFLDRIELC